MSAVGKFIKNIGQFVENSCDSVKKLGRQGWTMAALGTATLFAPALGQAQQKQTTENYTIRFNQPEKEAPIDQRQIDRDELLDGRDWLFSIGVAATPGTGRNGKTDINFDFHGVVPGLGSEGSFFGERNWIDAGARLTGRSFGGSYTYNTGDQKGWGGWSQKFSTAYLGYTVGQKFKLGAASRVVVGMNATANCFIGGANNWLNFAHLAVGPRVRADLIVPTADKGGLGLSLEATHAIYTKANNSLVNRFYQENSDFFGGVATQRQINPPTTIKAALTYKF